MVRAVSPRLVTTETKMQSWVSPCAIPGGKVKLERGFLRVFRLTPIIVILPMSYAHSIIYHRYYTNLAIVVVFKQYLKTHKHMFFTLSRTFSKHTNQRF